MRPSVKDSTKNEDGRGDTVDENIRWMRWTRRGGRDEVEATVVNVYLISRSVSSTVLELAGQSNLLSQRDGPGIMPIELVGRQEATFFFGTFVAILLIGV